MKSVLFAVLAAVCNVTFASERIIDWADGSPDAFHYQDGVRWATKAGPVSIALSLQPRDKSTAILQVFVLNSTEAPVNVLNRGISINDSNGPLKVWTPQDVAKQVKRAQFWDRLGTGLAAAGNSYNASQAGQYSQQGTYAGAYASQSGDAGKFAGNFSAQGYDSTAQQQATAQANAQNARLVSDLNARQQAQASNATAGMLMDQTLDSGASHAGYVIFDLPKRKRGRVQPLMIRIVVGDAVFEMQAQVSP